MPRFRRHHPRIRSAFSPLRGIWLWLAVVLFSVSLFFGWFSYEGERPILTPAQLTRAPSLIQHGETPMVEVVLPYGTSARGIAQILMAAGLDIHENMFLWHARWLGVQKNLQAGVYFFEAGLTKRQMIQRLAHQDNQQIHIRLIEGWTFQQITEALVATPGIRYDLPVVKSPSSLAAQLGIQAPHPEGWIYPDSYLVPRNFSATLLLSRAAVLQRKVLEDAWQGRAANLPFTDPFQALIVASIVEKETQFPGDREKVAAVFANRVRLRMPLQADPTVIYGLGSRFDGKITKKDLRGDTPYNTYTRKSLPPTPISNPGRRAISAVMNPADTAHLFFVARGDGSSEFSENLKDHNAAVNRFIRKLTGPGQ